MSEERSYKTTIRIPQPQLPKAVWAHGDLSVEESPALDLLRRAAEEVVAERGGSVDSSYLDCQGHKHRAWIAVHTADFQRGVGLTINASGNVSFRYDNATAVNQSRPELAGQVRFIHDRPDTAKDVCAEIVSRYVTLAAKRALESLECQVRVEKAEAQEGTGAVVKGTDAAGRERVVFVSPRGEVYVDLRGFTGGACVEAEKALRDRLGEFGLELETTWQRRKDAPAPAGFAERRSAVAGGEP
jgi:hypothetical protein